MVDNKLTGEVDGMIIDAQEKKHFLIEMCDKYGLDSANCIAVGDGANDLIMLNQAKLAVGYEPKPVLIEHVDVLNRTNDHRFLADLFLL